MKNTEIKENVQNIPTISYTYYNKGIKYIVEGTNQSDAYKKFIKLLTK